MSVDLGGLETIGLPHLHRTDARGLIPNLILSVKDMTDKTDDAILDYVSEWMPKGLWEDSGDITTVRGRDAKKQRFEYTIDNTTVLNQKKIHGTYGSIKFTTDGYVVKEIIFDPNRGDDFIDTLIAFLKETVIHGILSIDPDTRDYVPRIIKVFVDAPCRIEGARTRATTARKCDIRDPTVQNAMRFHIVMEQLNSDGARFFQNNPNDAEIYDYLSQIANGLDIMWRKYEFTHKDLKPDNTMYYDTGRKKTHKLIDFGFSSLTVPAIGRIDCREAEINRNSHDLMMLTYTISNFYSTHIPVSVQTFLQEMLSFRSPINIFGKVCRGVGDVVSALQSKHAKKYPWWQIYEFIDERFTKYIIKKPNNVYRKFEGELKNFIPRDFIGHIKTQCGSMCSIMGGSKQRKTRKKIRRKRTRRRLRKAKKKSRKRFRKLTKRL